MVFLGSHWGLFVFQGFTIEILEVEGFYSKFKAALSDKESYQRLKRTYFLCLTANNTFDEVLFKYISQTLFDTNCLFSFSNLFLNDDTSFKY